MRAMKAAVIIAACAAVAACGKERQVPPPDQGPAPGTTGYKVAQALTAGPDWMASVATVEQWPLVDTAQFEVLQPGGGSWTCFPDQPASPHSDPLCADEQFLGWLTAWRAHEQSPQLRGMAVAYALKGFQVASATDPLKVQPDAGQAWVDLPPAVFVATPNAAGYRGLPTTRPAAGPWVLWAGTPWAMVVMPMGQAPAPATSARK